MSQLLRLTNDEIRRGPLDRDKKIYPNSKILATFLETEFNYNSLKSCASALLLFY